MSTHIGAMLRELPGALAIATLTAAVTLLLALLLSATLGAESRDRSAATRCYAAQTINMLRSAHPELQRYPPVNTEGLKCARYLMTPIDDGSILAP